MLSVGELAKLGMCAVFHYNQTRLENRCLKPLENAVL
jgi:hypothetical protein